MGLLESDTTEWLHFHFSLSCIGEANGNPLQCSCLENPRDGRAWWAAVYGVAQSWTRLKRLSSSSSNLHLTLFSCDTHEKGQQSEYLFLGFIHHWFRDRLTMRLIDLKLRALFCLGCFQGPEMTLAVYSYGIWFLNICRQRHFDYSWWRTLSPTRILNLSCPVWQDLCDYRNFEDVDTGSKLRDTFSLGGHISVCSLGDIFMRYAITSVNQSRACF